MGGGIPSDYDLFYTMDSVTGTTLEDETGNYDGTIVNGATQVSGHIGQALNFDGSNDYVNSTYKTNGGSYSIACWVYRDTRTTQDAIYTETDTTTNSYGAYMVMRVDLDEVLVGHFKNAAGFDSQSVSIPLAEWFHIVFVRINNVSHEVFINGASVGSVSCADITNTSTFTGKLGGNPDYNQPALRPLDGKIDQFRIYDYALSESEILAIYNEA